MPRTKKDIPVDWLCAKVEEGLSDIDIAKHWEYENPSETCCPKTIQRRRNEEGLKQKVKDEEEVKALIVELVDSYVNNNYALGSRRIKADLDSRNINVGRKRVGKILRELDIDASIQRKKKFQRISKLAVHSDSYFTKGSFETWCMDMNEKLVRWKFYLYLCIDAHSCYIVYFHVDDHKRTTTVYRLFRGAIERLGIRPWTIRTDAGRECVLPHFCQFLHKAFSLIGTSPQNQRVEALNRQAIENIIEPFRNILSDVEKKCCIDLNDPIQIGALHRTYKPLIEEQLRVFVTRTNRHKKDGKKGNPTFLLRNEVMPGWGASETPELSVEEVINRYQQTCYTPLHDPLGNRLSSGGIDHISLDTPLTHEWDKSASPYDPLSPTDRSLVQQQVHAEFKKRHPDITFITHEVQGVYGDEIYLLDLQYTRQLMM